jgi:E3 ubiquitin-protein ligase DOA10
MRRRRRRRRRLILVGGSVLLASSHRNRKLQQQDADKIEQHTGVSVEELEDDELDQAINELGIEEQPLTAEDEAAIANAG